MSEEQSAAAGIRIVLPPAPIVPPREQLYLPHDKTAALICQACHDPHGPDARLLYIMNCGVPYVYVLRDGTGAPFYVGKGRGDRCYRHEEDADPNSKRRWGQYSNVVRRRLREMAERAECCQLEIVGTFETDEQALSKESETIQQLGTLKGGTGPLLNVVKKSRRRVEP